MGQNLIVTLRAYKGELKRDFDNPEKVTSENQKVKLVYKSPAWVNYLDKARLNHSRIDIESVKEEHVDYKDTGRKDSRGFSIVNTLFSYKDSEATEEMKSEVSKCMQRKAKESTPDQETIQSLKEEMRELKESIKKGNADSTPDVNEELEAARERYLEVFGKKPNHLMKLSSINAKIKEKLNS